MAAGAGKRLKNIFYLKNFAMTKTKDYPGEVWKNVNFNLDFKIDYRLEISNFGRMRSFTKVADGNPVAGSMINGYKIIRLKFYSPRPETIKKKLELAQQENFVLARKLKTIKENGTVAAIKEMETQLLAQKKKLSTTFKKELDSRVVHYHCLVHRLVAYYFLKKPIIKQTIVSHLDHEKLNNRASNLQWMTPEENSTHQQHSPYVVRKKEKSFERKTTSHATKLTVTKVMLIKKLLGEEKPVRLLAKRFKVTETQIYRIKKEENWADVGAAK